MGTCGTGISSNDSYCEVYEAFFSMYNEGKEVDGITTALSEIFKETIQSAEDQCNGSGNFIELIENNSEGVCDDTAPLFIEVDGQLYGILKLSRMLNCAVGIQVLH